MKKSFNKELKPGHYYAYESSHPYWMGDYRIPSGVKYYLCLTKDILLYENGMLVKVKARINSDSYFVRRSEEIL